MKLFRILFLVLISQLSLAAWPPYGALSASEENKNPELIKELFNAVHQGNLDKLQKVRAQKVSLNEVIPDDTSHITAILLATIYASKQPETYLPIIDYMLRCNADPNIPDRNGVTPVIIAAGSTHIKSEAIIRLLLLKDAKVNVSAHDRTTALSQAEKKSLKLAKKRAQDADNDTTRLQEREKRAKNIVNMLRIKSALEVLTTPTNNLPPRF